VKKLQIDKENAEKKRKEQEEKKARVPKWKIEHNKVVADIEPMLTTIKTFDCNRLYWLSQHMAKQKRKCLDNDPDAAAALKCYVKWITTTRNKGKLSKDVSSESVEKSDEESEEEEEEDSDD